MRTSLKRRKACFAFQRGSNKAPYKKLGRPIAVNKSNTVWPGFDLAYTCDTLTL